MIPGIQLSSALGTPILWHSLSCRVSPLAARAPIYNCALGNPGSSRRPSTTSSSTGAIKGPDTRSNEPQLEEIHSHELTAKETLCRFEELRTACAATNSPIAKRAIIARYPELRQLLELVTKPRVRFNMRLDGFEKYLSINANRQARDRRNAPEFSSLVDLLEALAQRRATGTMAKACVLKFLQESGVMRDATDTDTIEFAAFGRILERNLQAGVSSAVVDKVRWPEPQEMPGARSTLRGATNTSKGEGMTSSGGDKPLRGEQTDAIPVQQGRSSAVLKFDTFSCALGKTVKPPFDELFKGDRRWFASRKLDGVRCITFLDFVLPTHGEPWLMDIGFYSRSGNELTSLGNLATQLRRGLGSIPGLRDTLERDPTVCNENGRKRLVLDGEVCVMRPLTAVELAAHTDVDHGTAGSLWEDDGLTEDFAATVSQVKRKYEDVPYPAYFLLDVLSWAEFATRGASGNYLKPRSFSERQADVRRLGGYLASGDLSRYRPLVRHVVQQEISSRADLDGMIQRAAQQGWEGLVMRADEPYKGKRSSDVLKFKQWQDGEYTVLGRDTAVMRLAIDGVYGEHEACANVWIKHRGCPVSVGSGFTAEQRLRYARDPRQIIGKQITVEYFGESEAADRKGGLKSLRFPRVKQVWENGARNM